MQEGDSFSVYKGGGMVKHEASERRGYRYNIAGHIKIIREAQEYWEGEVFGESESIKKDDRLTFYTPKISKMMDTYNRRRVDGTIIGTYFAKRKHLSAGDIAYIDRGRTDGVELGNVFDIYSTPDEMRTVRVKHRIGTMRVITLMGDFATVLVTAASDIIPLGSLVSTRLIREARPTNAKLAKAGEEDDLDVDLHLGDDADDFLAKASEVKLTDEEKERLERKEKQYSTIEDKSTLDELERLEDEIITAETALNQAKLDEDKALEGQDLDAFEQGAIG